MNKENFVFAPTTLAFPCLQLPFCFIDEKYALAGATFGLNGHLTLCFRNLHRLLLFAETLGSVFFLFCQLQVNVNDFVRISALLLRNLQNFQL